MRSKLFHRRAALALAVLLLIAAAGALAAAGREHRASSGVIHACRRRGSGALRVVSARARCGRGELALAWNVRGPRGEPGVAGPTGSHGPPGASGATGPAGLRGTSGPVGASGPSGPAGRAGATGASGPVGQRGPSGPSGPQGVAGPKGDSGVGLPSLDALNGIPCATDAGEGAVELSYDAESHAVLTCVVGAVSAASIRINEFSTGVINATANEFVELVNGGGSTADVGGDKLVYRSATGTSDVVLATIPSGTIVAAGGFYLFGGSGYTGSASPDQTFATGLASSGGGLGLRDPDGDLVDSVGYGSSTNAFVETAAAPAPPSTGSPGSSDVRLPDGHDSNDNATDFTVSSSPTPRGSNH